MNYQCAQGEKKMTLTPEKASEYGKKGAAVRWSNKDEKRVEALNLRVTETEKQFIKTAAQGENISQVEIVIRAVKEYVERSKLKCR